MGLTEILLAIAGVIGLLIGGLAGRLVGKSQGKREGRNDAINEMQEADHERATDIRNRVERDLPDRVREMDGRGFRD